MEIKIEKLPKLVEKAGEIFLKPEGEKVLMEFMRLEEQMEQARTAIKEKLEAAALKLDPNFKKIQGDKVAVYYQAFGAKYVLDESRKDEIDSAFYEEKTTTKYSIDSKAVEKYAKEVGGLPVGIEAHERKKTIRYKQI